METKWEMVAANLMVKKEFQGYGLTGPNMKQKFDRLKADVEEKNALDSIFFIYLSSIIFDWHKFYS